MEVGMISIFAADGWPDVTDSQVFEEELGLACLADELGFDVAWASEHHFFDYSICPDNTQYLSHVAAKTSNIDIGTAAVIMPWNDPLRVAEKISMLDTMSNGRLRFGVGRGLARREYDLFTGIEMDEARGRLDEGTAMVLEALRTGYIEGDGPFFPQKRAKIRPSPERSFDDRFYAVASSSDSVVTAAQLKGRMTMFADRYWKDRLRSIEMFRQRYQELWNETPPPLLISDFCLCLPDADEVEAKVRQYCGMLLASLLEHYEIMGDHFADIKGYDAYARGAEKLKRVGESGYLDMLLESTTWGTPDQILTKLEDRRKLVGAFDMAPAFRYGGIPYEEATASMKLFAKECLPVIQSWDYSAAA